MKYITTLVSKLEINTSVISMADITQFPTGAKCFIHIDDETMYYTKSTGIIIRGEFGTPPAVHDVGSQVFLIVDEAFMLSLANPVVMSQQGSFGEAHGTSFPSNPSGAPMLYYRDDLDEYFGWVESAFEAFAMSDNVTAEVAAAFAAHVAESDPHTQYRLESADHTHQSTGAQGGKLDHGAALTGLTDDDHTQYIKHALATAAGDFLVASASGTVVKKTLEETKTILGLSGSGVSFPASVVFGPAHKTNSFEDLDLHTTIGSNSALVYLRCHSLSVTNLTFRKNGEAKTPEPSGTGHLVIATADGVGYILVVSDSGGIIEWKSSNVTLYKVAGHDDVASNGWATYNRVFVCKYTANANGIASSIGVRVKGTSTGNIILGIYADDGTGNNPTGNPLAVTASTAVSSGAERMVFANLTSNVNITSGTVYWLAYITSAELIGYKTEAGRYFYKDQAFGALPSPYGTGWTGPGTTEQPIIQAVSYPITDITVEAYI
jgi:hypothetical protein